MMRFMRIWVCIYLSTTQAAPSPAQLGLDIIDLAAISRMSPKQLEMLAEGLAAEEIMRTKRSSAQALSTVVSKASSASSIGSKIGLLGQASSGALAFITSASSKSGQHDDQHEHHGYSYEPHESKVDFWGLKKSILYTLLQAVKAITGGVTILKGQLIKGGGHLAAAVGKVISVKGEAVSNFGKKIVSSAALSHKKPAAPVYGPPPSHHHLEYPPSAYGAPTAPAHYHTAPSAPTGYAAHKYPSHLDEMIVMSSVVDDAIYNPPPPYPSKELIKRYNDLVSALWRSNDTPDHSRILSQNRYHFRKCTTLSDCIRLNSIWLFKRNPDISFDFLHLIDADKKMRRSDYGITLRTNRIKDEFNDFMIDLTCFSETGRGKLNGVHAGLVILTPLDDGSASESHHTPHPAHSDYTSHTGHTPLEPPQSILHTAFSAIKSVISSVAPALTQSITSEPDTYQPPPPPIPSFKPMSWSAVNSYGEPAMVEAYPDYDPRNPHPPFDSYASNKKSAVPRIPALASSLHRPGLTSEKIQKISHNLDKIAAYMNEHNIQRSSEEHPKITAMDVYRDMLVRGQIPLLPTPVVTDNEIGVLSADLLPSEPPTITTTSTTTTTTTTTTTEKPTTTTENQKNRRKKDVKYILRGNRIVLV